MNPGVAAARFLTASPGRTALIGAGVGAAANALRAAPGESRGAAAFRGALAGGALAGGAAGVGRAYRDTRLLRPDLRTGAAVGATAKRLGAGVANFGKRQVHGLTGAFDHDAIGMAGNATAARRAELLGARMGDELKHAPAGRADAVRKSYQGQIAGTLQEGRASQSLADAGITTVPGIARSLWGSKTRGSALRAMGRSITDGPGGAALSLGAPAALAAPSLLRGDESAAGGLTRGQKARNLGINVATGAAFGGLPLAAQMAAGIGTDIAVGRLGRRGVATVPGGAQ